jgi:hypothetical protein
MLFMVKERFKKVKSLSVQFKDQKEEFSNSKRSGFSATDLFFTISERSSGTLHAVSLRLILPAVLCKIHCEQRLENNDRT